MHEQDTDRFTPLWLLSLLTVALSWVVAPQCTVITLDEMETPVAGGIGGSDEAAAHAVSTHINTQLVPKMNWHLAFM